MWPHKKNESLFALGSLEDAMDRFALKVCSLMLVIEMWAMGFLSILIIVSKVRQSLRYKHALDHLGC